MSSGFMYILECADGSYYTGSTIDLERRLWEHQNSRGANYTKGRLPVKLVYYEEFSRVDDAFYREKQVQGWCHKKKKILIEGRSEDLPFLSRNYTQFGRPVTLTKANTVASTGSATDREKGTEPLKVPCLANFQQPTEKRSLSLSKCPSLQIQQPRQALSILKHPFLQTQNQRLLRQVQQSTKKRALSLSKCTALQAQQSSRALSLSKRPIQPK